MHHHRITSKPVEAEKRYACLAKFREGEEDEKEIAMKFGEEASSMAGKSPLFKPSCPRCC